MKTENVHIFSKRRTPNFPIATAARMSMGLPGIFKPVIIQESGIPYTEETRGKNSWMAGTWIDSGYFNNAPAGAFEDIYNILLFRLGDREANNTINGILSFLKAWAGMGVLGSGSGQVTATTFPTLDLIELDVDKLSLLEFTLSEERFNTLKLKNINITLDGLKKNYGIS